jgi:hypothetical protein
MRIAFVPDQAAKALTRRALFGAGNAHFHFRDCQERENDAAWILTAGHLADPG